MAERLTVCIDSHLLDNGEMVKEYSLNNNIKLNQFSVMDIPNAVYDKLGELEDIMDKYGIDNVEELDKKIAYYIDKIDLEAENEYLKKVIEKQNMISKIISKNRDTWQKACELACEREDDCYVYDNIHRAYEFYQQAKKESESK